MDVFTPSVATIRGQHVSPDGSTKFLWQMADGHTVESVTFSFREQFYACISSQVGCNVGCPFCAARAAQPDRPGDRRPSGRH